MKCYGTRLLGNRFKLFRRCYSIQPPKILWPLRIEKPEIDDDHNYKTWSDIEGGKLNYRSLESWTIRPFAILAPADSDPV